ncbi:MAG: hypothetical protein KA251_09130, partial [Saprospiraceae bacterium]|nr:hypothetical protein [Saprospiraceae bacterium]
QYASSGSYKVSLKVSSPACLGSVTKEIEVKLLTAPPPNPPRQVMKHIVVEPFRFYRPLLQPIQERILINFMQKVTLKLSMLSGTLGMVNLEKAWR